MHTADGVHELVGAAGLEHGSLRAGFTCSLVEATLLVCGHQQRRSRNAVEAKVTDQLCAPPVRQAVVHEQDVDLPPSCERECLRCRHGDSGEADRGALESHANPARNHRIVLHEENG